MKLTVSDWESVQNECFTDEDRSSTFRDGAHRELYDLIEDRTFGKRYSQQVAIGLRTALYGDLTPLVNDAIARVSARKAGQEDVR
jgi:hypothetical protein